MSPPAPVPNPEETVPPANQTTEPASEEPITPVVAVDERLNLLDDSGDSAYEEEQNSYTTSLASQVTTYKFKNGRRYHAYKEGSYIYPNDEGENDRLDIVHKMVEVAMDGKLHSSPLENPGRILDIGTGTGIWAMEIAEKFPQADVLGNDLSPIQPRWVPTNVHFEVDDVEAEWTYARPFDFIHCRTMAGSIRDWPKLFKQCFDNLAPGGYAEFIDYDGHYTSPDGSLKENSDIAVLNRLFLKTASDNGMDASPGRKLQGWMKEAGFEAIQETRKAMPFGTWPADKKLKEVGAWNYLMIGEGLEGIVNYLFGHYLGMSQDEINVVCAKVRKQLKDPKCHIMYGLHIVYGRKPNAPPTTTSNEPEA